MLHFVSQICIVNVCQHFQITVASTFDMFGEGLVSRYVIAPTVVTIHDVPNIITC